MLCGYESPSLAALSLGSDVPTLQPPHKPKQPSASDEGNRLQKAVQKRRL